MSKVLPKKVILNRIKPPTQKSTKSILKSSVKVVKPKTRITAGHKVIIRNKKIEDVKSVDEDNNSRDDGSRDDNLADSNVDTENKEDDAENNTEDHTEDKSEKNADSDIEIEFDTAQEDITADIKEKTNMQPEEVYTGAEQENADEYNDNPGDDSELDEILLKKRMQNSEDLEDDEVDMEDLEEKIIKPVIKKLTGSKAKLRAMVASASQEDEFDVPIKKTRTKRTTTAKVGVKKGPGRPRKTPKKEPIPRKGIVRSPSTEDGYVEFMYDQPLLLKKVFQFLKQLAASQFQMLFRPEDIIIYAEDHHGKSQVYVKIYADKLNHYYCRGVLDIGMTSRDMEMILNKADKEYSSIIFISSVDSRLRTIDIILENDIQIDELHTIDLITPSKKMENEDMFTDEDYMIKFEFPSKYFRKTINDIKTMSTQLSITQEDAGKNLVFEYLTPNKKIQSKHTVKNSNRIKFESNLEEGDSFRVDVCIDYIKPISASQIADEVIILVDENKALMTKAVIDNGTIEIKTLTEIIDDRPEDDE